MNLDEALQLVRKRFQEEQRGEVESQTRADYEAASAAWPVTMLVAVHLLGDSFQATLPPLTPLAERAPTDDRPEHKHNSGGATRKPT